MKFPVSRETPGVEGDIAVLLKCQHKNIIVVMYKTVKAEEILNIEINPIFYE